MDTGELGKALVNGFKMIALLVGVIVTIIFGLTISSITLGVLFQVASSGDISVTGNTLLVLSSIEGNWNALVGKLASGAAFGGSLIPLVIVILVLGGGAYAGYNAYKKSKGGNGNDY